MTTYAPPAPRTLRRPAPRRPAARRPASRKAAMDPRVHARRVAVTREAGRRRLHRLLWVLGAVAVAGAGTGAVLSPLLDVNQISVVGVEGAHADEVIAAAGVQSGEPLLTTDNAAVVERVEALSWVADVHVVRQLPGTLRVEVTPRFPVAWRAIDGGGFAIFDRRGVAISTAPEPSPGLPEINATGADVRAAARVASALSPALTLQVTSIAVENDYARLILVSGMEVRFGDIRELAAKVTATEAMLAALGPTWANYLDVTSPSQPAIG